MSNKDKFYSEMKKLRPDIEIVGEYINNRTPIFFKSKYGLHKALPATLKSSLKIGIQSAINKQEYYLRCLEDTYGSRFIYDKTVYEPKSKTLTLICPKHGEFIIHKSNLSKGQGCYKCGIENRIGGYSRSNWIHLSNGRECTVYKIRCYNDTEEFYKIGRTCGSVNSRFPKGTKMPYEYEVIEEIKGSAGFIFDLENELHAKHKEYKYCPSLDFHGKTECYIKLI